MEDTAVLQWPLQPQTLKPGSCLEQAPGGRGPARQAAPQLQQEEPKSAVLAVPAQ